MTAAVLRRPTPEKVVREILTGATEIKLTLDLAVPIDLATTIWYSWLVQTHFPIIIGTPICVVYAIERLADLVKQI